MTDDKHRRSAHLHRPQRRRSSVDRLTGRTGLAQRVCVRGRIHCVVAATSSTDVCAPTRSLCWFLKVTREMTVTYRNRTRGLDHGVSDMYGIFFPTISQLVCENISPITID